MTPQELQEKLSETFRINPLYEADGYKPMHIGMLAPGATRLYGTMIPRTFKYMPGGIDKLMCAGPQLTVRYIHSAFSENFFYTKSRYLGKSVFSKAGNATLRKKALKFAKDLSLYFNAEHSGKHFEDLWDLGYLPVEFKALPEGIFTDANIPHMTFINTVDGYAWLTLFLETIVSKLSWQMPIAATIGHKYRQNANEAVAKTNKKDMWLAEFMCHDFHSRGGNPFTSIAVGLGHAFSNKGSDTLNVIPSSRYYYDEDDDFMPIYSVLASEHSVTCTQLFYYQDRLKRGLENETIKHFYSFDLPCEGSVENPDYLAIAEYMNLRDWLQRFPKGILSYVADTMDLWKVITQILPRLKSQILERDGKLVIRPDSGNPVDIVCGVQGDENYYWNNYEGYIGSGVPNSAKIYTKEEVKGVIELLWDIFGGTVSDEGYKVLDPHIGAIYGDSITLERQVQIYSGLAEKGFAATNIVLGVGLTKWPSYAEMCN